MSQRQFVSRCGTFAEDHQVWIKDYYCRQALSVKLQSQLGWCSDKLLEIARRTSLILLPFTYHTQRQSHIVRQIVVVPVRVRNPVVVRVLPREDSINVCSSGLHRLGILH